MVAVSDAGVGNFGQLLPEKYVALRWMAPF